MPGTSSGARIRGNTCRVPGPAHPRRALDRRVDLLDERRHGEDHERHRRHQVGQHHPGQVPGEAVLVEHGRQRDAVGDRRHQDRQQEQQVDHAPAGEGPAGQHVGRRHADQHRDRPRRAATPRAWSRSTWSEPELAPRRRRTSGSCSRSAARCRTSCVPNELTTTEPMTPGQVEEEERRRRPRPATRRRGASGEACASALASRRSGVEAATAQPSTTPMTISSIDAHDHGDRRAGGVVVLLVRRLVGGDRDDPGRAGRVADQHGRREHAERQHERQAERGGQPGQRAAAA